MSSVPYRSSDAGGPLTAVQLGEFARRGFLVLDSPQVSQADIDWCRGLLLSMFDREVGKKEGTSFDIAAREGGSDGATPQIFRPSLYAPELRAWKFRAVGLEIARQLLGPDVALASDNAVYKPRRIGGPTPWHQDEAYNDPRFYQRQVTIWIALFPTTIDNGAMTFIPGSHLLGILPHRLHGGAAEANSIECCSGFDATSAHVCLLPAGGLTIHHGLTVHGASANRSEVPRMGYIFNYKTPPEPRPELGEFPWNATVARSIHRQRKLWRLRGGIIVEILRFLRSGRDNQRHYFIQLRKRLLGKR